MKYEIQRTSSFKKDYKLIKKRGYDISKLKPVIAMLAEGQEICATVLLTFANLPETA